MKQKPHPISNGVFPVALYRPCQRAEDGDDEQADVAFAAPRGLRQSTISIATASRRINTRR